MSFKRFDQVWAETQSVYGGKEGNSDVFDFLSILQKWGEIVGPYGQKHLRPLGLQYGVLLVYTDHPAVAQEMTWNRELFVKKIHVAIPRLQTKLKNCQFKLNRHYFKESKETPRPKEQDKALEVYEQLHYQYFHSASPQHRKLIKEAESLFTYETEEARSSFGHLFKEWYIREALMKKFRELFEENPAGS